MTINMEYMNLVFAASEIGLRQFLSANSNVSQIADGIIRATSHLSKTCELKHKNEDVHELVRKATIANLDIEFSKLVSPEDQKLKDMISLQLLTYWCWWAYVAYLDPSQLAEVLPTKTFHHFNFQLNIPGQPYFFLTVDPYSRSIIICIRGSYSISDAISDMSGSMRPFLPNIEVLAHTGFVTAAENVMKNAEPLLGEYIARYPDYQVKVVGHSYGAAVSSVICTWLEYQRQLQKNNIKTPVRSYQFCCPPVYNDVGQNLVCKQENQISTVMGWDPVPRASLNNVQLFLCKKAPEPKDFSYIPGNVLWFTYDDDTGKMGPIYNLDGYNPAFLNLYMHPNMVEDHLLSKTYGYLLAHIVSKLKAD